MSEYTNHQVTKAITMTDLAASFRPDYVPVEADSWGIAKSDSQGLLQVIATWSWDVEDAE